MSDLGIRFRATTRGGGGGGGRTTLQPSDIEFLGFKRFDNSAIGYDLTQTRGTIAIRRVGADIRIFLDGDVASNSPLLEFNYGSSSPNTNISSAPTMSLNRQWGDISSGRVRLGADSGEGGNDAWFGGLYWDDTLNAVWRTYGCSYVPPTIPGGSHPNLVCAVLNDGTGGHTAYGPFRFGTNANFMRAGFVPLPADFAAAHTSGKAMGQHGTINSGVAQMPFGPNLSAYTLPTDPSILTVASVSNSTVTVPTKDIILNAYGNPRARDASRYRNCGWVAVGGVNYDCRNGSVISPGTALWGGPDPASGGENDQMHCGTYVQTATKEGYLCFGQMTATPTGVTAPGDPDGLYHVWYGDTLHATATGSSAAGYQNGYCCHGQRDYRWGTTGPGSGYRQPLGWIFSRAQLESAADGGTAIGSVYPAATDAFELQNIHSVFQGPIVFDKMFGNQMVFDATSGLVFACFIQEDFNHTGHVHPTLAVFRIN
jgi:hypothetical protein